MSFLKHAWKIEARTGDAPPKQEWLELHGVGQRFRYVDRDEAERMLAKLQTTQPHGEFRIAPV